MIITVRRSAGNVENSIRYAGYQYDEETGLYYLNARMYDPETSRFLQEDTYTGDKKDPLSLNLYTYCHNNPLIYDDPTGHFAHILLGGVVGGVLSVVATGITNLVTTGKLGSAKQYVGAFASGFVEGAVGAATLGIGSIAAKVAIDAATSFGSNLIEQKITTGKVSLKKAAVETATGMAISGAASKVAKKFQNSKINQKLTKKLDDVTLSLKSKTKNITANIAKKTKEATQKAVNTVSDKAKTIANKTLNETSTSKSVKNKVASAIDSLGEGILSVRNVFAPQKVINAGPIKIVVKDIKTGFGQSGEETLSQALGEDVQKLKTMFFSKENSITKSEYNILRKKTPSNKIRKEINPEGTKKDPVYGYETDVLEADHIVPMKEIVNMPGFSQLSRQKQIEVLNLRENFIGLGKSTNASKGAKSWSEWKGHSKLGKIPDSVREEMLKLEELAREKLIKAIEEKLDK